MREHVAARRPSRCAKRAASGVAQGARRAWTATAPPPPAPPEPRIVWVHQCLVHMHPSQERAHCSKLPAPRVRSVYEACCTMQVGGEDEEAMDQHSLLPSASEDPKLWMVKCQAGMEKQIVAQLMSKYIAMQEAGTPLAIYSAFCQEIPPSAVPLHLLDYGIGSDSSTRFCQAGSPRTDDFAGAQSCILRCSLMCRGSWLPLPWLVLPATPQSCASQANAPRCACQPPLSAVRSLDASSSPRARSYSTWTRLALGPRR
jgi:Early transcription elongation factor of RNA pol II, NGN section